MGETILEQRERTSRRRDLAGLLVVLTYCAAILIPKITKVLPLNDGWWLLWHNQSEHQFPYRDFYFPFPPFELLATQAWAHASDPILAYRYFAFVENVLIVVLVYLIARRFSGVFASTLATLIAFSAYESGYVDVVGTFFTTATLLQLSALCALVYANRYRIPLEFVAGICFGLAFLTKQTAIATFIGVIACLILVQRRRGLSDVARLIVGFSVPLALTFLWLYANHAVQPFLIDVFGGGGKEAGPNNTILVVSNLFADGRITAAILIICALISSQLRISTYRKFLLVSSLSSLGLMALLFGSDSALTPWTISIFLIPLLASLMPGMRRWLQVTFGAAIAILLLLSRMNDFGNFLTIQSGIGEARQFPFAVFCLIALPTVGFLAFHQSSMLHSWRHTRRQLDLWIIISSFLAWALVAQSLSGGVSPEPLIWGAAVLFAIAFQAMLTSQLGAPRVLATYICVMITVPFSIFSCVTPYRWFGWQEPSVFSARGDSSSHATRNFNLSAEAAGFYSVLQSNLDSVAGKVADEKDSKGFGIFAAPHIPFVYQMTSLPPVQVTCPILYWDVCPEQASLKTVSEIEGMRPSVLVLEYASDDGLASHENAFRKGRPSAIRELYNWADRQVALGLYHQQVELIPPQGSQCTPASSCWRVRILFRPASR